MNICKVCSPGCEPGTCSLYHIPVLYGDASSLVGGIFYYVRLLVQAASLYCAVEMLHLLSAHLRCLISRQWNILSVCVRICLCVCIPILCCRDAPSLVSTQLRCLISRQWDIMSVCVRAHAFVFMRPYTMLSRYLVSSAHCQDISSPGSGILKCVCMCVFMCVLV